MVSAYLQLEPLPEHEVFRTRLGLCVMDLAAGVDRAAAPRLLSGWSRKPSVRSTLAWDVLAHELCRSALSGHDLDTLVETVESSGLRRGTMPSHLLDALVTSVKVGEEQLSDALAQEVHHVPDVPR